ncbi:hypothetical protein DBA29_26500 [Xenophilus aerolatus]|nr:hypothetical protein [Xenophilus aerolatus]
MAQEKLHGAEILGLSVDERCLGATHRVRAVVRRIQAQLLDPVVENSGVLAGAKMRRVVYPAGEQKVLRPQTCCLDPLLDGITCGAGDLELHRTLGLLLHDDSARGDLLAVADVMDLERNEVTSTQLIAHGVIGAAMEFLKPLAGSSAATLVIFVPLAFLSGVTGEFFKALSLTMAAALGISFLVTWLAVPLLAQYLLKGDRPAKPDRLTRWFHQHYKAWLVRCIAHPTVLLVCVAALLVTGVFAFRQVGSGFMPAMDEGGFILDYRTPPGTALSETDRLARQIEQIMREMPEVDTYSRRTATGLGGGLSEANQGDFFVRLKSGSRRPVQAVMQDVRNRVEHQVPGVSIELAQLMEDLIGDLTAVPQPVEVKLFGTDPKLLAATAGQVAQEISKVSGLVGVRSGINPAGDAIAIHVNRVAAAAEGLDPDQITRSLQGLMTGNVATTYAEEAKAVGVRVWTPASDRATQSQLADLPLRAPDGHMLPLGRVATFETLAGQPQITRENLNPMVAVTARIEGRDLGSVIQDVKKVLDSSGALPKGVHFELGGLYQQQQLAFKGLMAVFAAAAALVFLLLLFLYESFPVPLSILCTSLLSVSAVFIGLWLTNLELNISAMMGMTMIIGIVTEVAVFYFSEQQNRLERHPNLIRSLIGAGQFRARPIAMTTLAAILTLLPLALAIGAGSEMQQPLAVAIISGLVVQLPLVLFFMPTLYAWIETEREKGAQSSGRPLWSIRKR